MRRELPPLNALLAFEAAARHCNFTRAAEELSIAQPAVTRHISNIEGWIGAPLFARNGSVVTLTEQGRRLSDLATAALDRLELGVRDVRRFNRDELVAGASFGVAHLWIMPRISAMRAASGMNINLVTSDDYATFDDRAVDFSIRFGNGDFGRSRSDRLFEEQGRIIAAPSFLARNPGFDPHDVAGTIDPRLMLDHGDPRGIGWLDWETWFRLTGGVSPGRHRFTLVESYPTMLDMVRAGEGVSIGTLGIEDDLVAAGALQRVGPTVGRPGHGYYLVYGPERMERPAFRKLRAHLIAHGRSDEPTI